MNSEVSGLLRLTIVLILSVMAVVAAALAVWTLFCVLIFFGNFQFGKPAHAYVFAESWLFVFTSFVANIRFWRRRSVFSSALVVLSVCLARLTVWLWALPGANGLAH